MSPSSERVKEKIYDKLEEIIKNKSSLTKAEVTEMVWEEVVEYAMEQVREEMLRLSKYVEGTLN